MSAIGYFGDGWQGTGEKLPTPLGSRCLDCDQRIAHDDQGYIVRLDNDRLKPQHRHHRPEDA